MNAKLQELTAAREKAWRAYTDSPSKKNSEAFSDAAVALLRYEKEIIKPEHYDAAGEILHIIQRGGDLDIDKLALLLADHFPQTGFRST